MSDLKISAFAAGAQALGTDLTLVARAGSSLQVPLSDLVLLAPTFSVKTTNFTAAKNNIYALNANSLTVTFPASPSAGDGFQLIAATASVAAFTTARNGSNINSAAADVTVGNFWSVKAVYKDSSVGWRLTWTPALLGLLDLSAATAGQMKFPSSANLSSDANTLDAYAEGTWTPVLKFGGATTGITYNFQTGNYTRVGRMVHLFCEFQLTNKGSAVGSAIVSGLPFSNAAVQDGFVAQHMLSMNAALTKNISGYLSTDMQLVTADGVANAITDAHFTNVSLIEISMLYRV